MIKMDLATYIQREYDQSVLDKLANEEVTTEISRYVDIDNNKKSQTVLGPSTKLGNSSDNGYTNLRLNDKSVLDYKDILISHFKSFLFPLSRTWIALTTGDDKIDTKSDVKEYLKDSATRVIQSIMTSNFPSEITPALSDCVDYGLGCLLLQDNDDGIHFKYIPFNAYYFGEDYKGKVVRSFVTYNYKPYQLAGLFDDEYLMKFEFTEGSYELVHFVIKKDFLNKMHFEGKEVKGNKDFVSGYYIKDLKTKSGEPFLHIDTKGYNEMPYLRFRWRKFTDIYGVGIGHKAVVPARIINQVTDDVLDGVEKIVNPSFLFNDDSFIDQFTNEIMSGTYLFSDSGRSGELAQNLFKDIKLPYGFEARDRFDSQMDKMYFSGQFQNTKNAEQSATEIQDIRNQRNRTLGPHVLTITNDLINPMIDRVFRVLSEKNKLDDAPDTLKNNKMLMVKYESQLNDSAGQQELVDLQSAIQVSIPFIELNRRAGARINSDDAIQKVFKVLNQSDILNNDERVKEVHDRMSEDEQKQQNIVEEQERSKSAKDQSVALKNIKE